MFERYKMNTRCSNKHANTVPTSRGQGVNVYTLAPAQAGAVAAGTAKFRRENLASLTSLDEVKAGPCGAILRSPQGCKMGVKPHSP